MLKETSYYDEQADKLIVKTSYDNSDVLKANAEDRDAKPENFGKYKGTLTHVGSIHMGDVVRLKNLGYNLLSPDVDEKRRALCYIQTNEPYLLTVAGKPFARTRKTWA
ncbi:MAG: hypothetical protein WC047_00545 [Kiritimatiellales bacterium]